MILNDILARGQRNDNRTSSFVILGHRAGDPVDFQLPDKFDISFNAVWILGSAPKDDDVEKLNNDHFQRILLSGEEKQKPLFNLNLEGL